MQRSESVTLLPQITPTNKERGFKLYSTIVTVGLSSHFGALLLTFLAIQGGLGAEQNPLFYVMGPFLFVVLFAFGMVLYYLFTWKLELPWQVKCVAAMILTGNAAFDFEHDLVFYVAKTTGIALGIHI